MVFCQQFKATILAFECALMYYVCAVWPKHHPDQKLMISWAFYSLCVGIAARVTNLLRDVVTACAGNDIMALQKWSWLSTCACILGFGFAMFQSGWAIIGILRYCKMEKTSDDWFTYGILTELVLAGITGAIVYAVILFMFIGCSCIACIGCEIDNILNQLPQSLKEGVSDTEGKLDISKFFSALGVQFPKAKQNPDLTTNSEVKIEEGQKAGKTDTKDQGEAQVDVEERMPLKNES